MTALTVVHIGPWPNESLSLLYQLILRILSPYPPGRGQFAISSQPHSKHSLSPYITDLLSVKPAANYALRSSGKSLLLVEFNNTFYIQTHGTAMGTRMAPSYANLFLAKFETDALTHAPFQPHAWWRFIDDIFMIWTHAEDELRTFITYLKQHSPHYQIHFIPFSNIYFFSRRQGLT